MTSLSITEPADAISGECISERPPMSHSMTFEMELEPGSAMKALDLAFEKARAEGKLPQGEKVAELACDGCGTTEGYRRTHLLKEVMIQLDEFSSAHAGCSRKGKNDGQKHGEIGDAL